MDLFEDEAESNIILPSNDLKVNQAYADRFTHNKRRAELDALREKFGDQAELPDDSETDSEEDETEDEDGEQATADVDAALMRTLARIKNRDQDIYDSNQRIFESEHQRVLETDPKASQSNQKKEQRSKEKRMTLQDYQRQRVEELIKTSADPARALADATTNPARQVYLDQDVKPQTHVQEQEDLRRQVTAAFHDAGAADGDGDDLGIKAEQDDDDDNDDFFKPKKSKVKVEHGDDDAKSVLQPAKKGKKGKGKEADDEAFLMNYVLNRGWVDSGADDEPTTSSTNKHAYGRDWEAEAAELESEDSFDSRAEAFETAYNFRFESIANGSAPAAVQSFARPAQQKESVRREDDSRKRKREERKERKEREKAEKVAELERYRGLQREEIRDRVKRIIKEAGAEEEAQFADLDLDGDFDPDAHDRAMSSAFNDGYYATGEGAAGEEGDEGDFDPAGEDEDGKPVWDDDIDIDDILAEEKQYTGDNDDDEDGSSKKKAKKAKKKEKKEMKKELRKKLKALEKKRANGEADDDDEEEEEEKDGVAEAGQVASSSKIKLDDFDPEEYKAMSKEERKQKVQQMVDDYYDLDYEDMIGDMPTRFKYASVPKIDYGLSPAEILMASDKDLNEVVGLKMLQPYRKNAKGESMKKPADLGRRLREFRAKLDSGSSSSSSSKKNGGDGSGAKKRAAKGAAGEDGSEQPPSKKKRLGRKERERLKAQAGGETSE
ncbi:Kinetochore protein Spc24 [Tilletia horrida]|nr:Kinetochore protein Spc24 [Tilletia horrida]